MVSRFVSVATGPGVSGDYFMGGGEMYSHKRNAGASGDRPDGEMGVRKAEKEEMDNGQLTIGKSVLRMEVGISPSVSCADSSLIRGSLGSLEVGGRVRYCTWVMGNADCHAPLGLAMTGCFRRVRMEFGRESL